MNIIGIESSSLTLKPQTVLNTKRESTTVKIIFHRESKYRQQHFRHIVGNTACLLPVRHPNLQVVEGRCLG